MAAKPRESAEFDWQSMIPIVMAPVGDPHRRSWPYPPTRLERLAKRAGIGDEDLRAWLYEELGRRRMNGA